MKYYFLLALLLVSMLCYAQWSTDPQVNNAICTLTGEQAIPKVAACPDGSVYIAWFSNDTGNYDVRLQRLDYAGNLLWETNGILVSGNDQMTWLTQWDMRADSQGNAILAFQDIRWHDNPDVFVYKVAPDGSFPWGEDGVALTNNDDSNMLPQLAITDQDNVIVCWSNGSTNIQLQKVLANGTVYLDQPLTLTNTSYRCTYGQPIAVSGDSFILKYFRDTGATWAPTRHVYARKYDTNVAQVWTEDTALTTQGGMNAWSYTLALANDGADGFWAGWYDDRDNNNDYDNYVQHVNADGTLSFDDGGVSLGTSGGYERFMPTLAEADDGVFAFWVQTNSDQSSWGIYGQFITTTGGCQWGGDGATLIPIGDRVVSPVKAAVFEGQAVVVYQDDANSGTTDNTIKAMRVNQDGQLTWADPQSDVSLASGDKVHVTASGANINQMVVSWEDGRTGTSDIYAQNIGADGSIGPQTVPGTIVGTVTLSGGAGDVTDVVITVNATETSPAADGTYSINIAPGQYDMTFVLDGYETVTVADVTVESGGETQVDAELEWIGPSGINGTVTLNGGTGDVTQAVITVNDQTTNPATDGTYSLDLDPGTYTVTFTLEHYEDVEVSNVTVSAGAYTQVNATLEWLTSGISGTVTLSGGSGDVTQVVVTVDELTTNPAADGTYSLELDPGTYTVTFTLTGYQTFTAEGIAVSAGSFTDLDATLLYEEAVENGDTNAKFALSAYPNPFNPQTSLQFSLTQPGAVRLDIYDVRGRHMETVANGHYESGAHKIVWDATGLASGVYFARLHTTEGELVTRMLLLK